MKKRLLPALLALAMVLTMLPLAAFAEVDPNSTLPDVSNLTEEQVKETIEELLDGRKDFIQDYTVSSKADLDKVIALVTAAEKYFLGADAMSEYGKLYPWVKVNVTVNAGDAETLAAALQYKWVTTVNLTGDISDVSSTLNVPNKSYSDRTYGEGLKPTSKTTKYIETVLNLGSHSITFSNADAVIDVMGKLKIEGTGSITGALTSSKALISCYCKNTTFDTSLTIGEGVTVKSGATGGYGVAVFPGSALEPGKSNFKVNIDGKVEGVYGAVSVNGNVQGTDKYPVINVGATAELTATSQTAGAGIYAAGYGEYNIEGSVSGYSGIAIKSGVLNVSGNAEITGTGDYQDPTSTAGGFTPTGAAISIDSRTGYAGDMEINILKGADGSAPTLSSESGNVIDEALPNLAAPEDSKIVEVNVEDGTFNAGEKAGPDGGKREVFALEVASDASKRTVTVSGGTFNTPLTNLEYLDTTLKVEAKDEAGNIKYFETEDDIEAGFTKTETELIGITVNVTAGEGSVNVPETVAADDVVTLTPVPGANYDFESIKVLESGVELTDGLTDKQDGSYEFTASTGKTYEIQVSFTQKKATLSWSAPAAGGTFTVTVNKTEINSGDQVGAGDLVTVTCSPLAGGSVKSVTAGSEDVTRVNATTYTFVMPTSATTITVEFETENTDLKVENVSSDINRVAKVRIRGMQEGRVYGIRIATTAAQSSNSITLYVDGSVGTYYLYCQTGMNIYVNEFASRDDLNGTANEDGTVTVRPLQTKVLEKTEHINPNKN